MGGMYHLKLNISKRPIANKYREGKMKRTLKRELKAFEIAEREAFGPSSRLLYCNREVTCVGGRVGTSASVRSEGTRPGGDDS